jgi:membrane-associated phospholipid phosphatase
MSFTAAVAAHLLGLGRRWKIGLWIWFAVTTAATIYLGWHYVLDDVAGVVLGAMALALAAALSGVDLRTRRQRRGATAPARSWAQPGGGHQTSPSRQSQVSSPERSSGSPTGST